MGEAEGEKKLKGMLLQQIQQLKKYSDKNKVMNAQNGNIPNGEWINFFKEWMTDFLEWNFHSFISKPFGIQC